MEREGGALDREEEWGRKGGEAAKAKGEVAERKTKREKPKLREDVP